MQLTPHLHCVVPDGVFVDECETEAPEFHPLPAPTDLEVTQLLLKVVTRIDRLFKRRGLLEDNGSDGGPASALDELQRKSIEQQRSLPMGFLESAKPRPTKSRSAFIEGFSCHADLHLHANDREGLERLLLYGGRGPIANERLALLPDGRVSYSMKRPAPDGRTHLVCSTLDFMRKLAAIVPPPRVNLLRFHGVFGPSARLRPRVVPVPEKPAQRRPAKQKRFDFQTGAGADAREEAPQRRSTYSWPELMKRTFLSDVLECSHCRGRMRILAFITDGTLARTLLQRMGLSGQSPPRKPPVGPPQRRFAFAA